MGRRSEQRPVFRGTLVLAIMVVTTISGVSTADAVSAGLVPDEICSVLGDPFGEKAAEKLPEIVTGGKHSGGLGWSVLIALGAQQCDRQELLAALPRSQDFLSKGVSGASTPSLAAFRQELPHGATAGQVSVALQSRYPAATPQVVATLANNLCLDVTGRRLSSAAADVQELLPDIDVDHLVALNQLTSIVVNQCSGITKLQADGLTSQLTNIALSNTFPDDVTPPFVLGPTWSRTNDPRVITLAWTGLDIGGSVASFDVSVRDPGQSWKSLFPGTADRSGTVNLGSLSAPPTFAVRAVDANGNVSGWAYMTPCLSCG